MSQFKILDLFSCQGGAAWGYHLAGFEVHGCDIAYQKRYPFPMVVCDWREYLEKYGHLFDAIHASPPCQAYTRARPLQGITTHPQLIEPVREALQATGKPYVIENVIGAPVVEPVMLCGLSFGLKVFRHRHFESNVFLMAPPHVPHGNRRIGVDGMCCVAGHGDSGGMYRKDREQAHSRRIPIDHRSVPAWKRAMDIDWMTRDGLSQAIPPAYTKWIGDQLLEALK